MIDDRNPNFGRGFRISTRQLGDLQSTWREAGRRVWEAGTRLGQDVKARTEKELEALGREHLRQAELRKAQARAAGQAVEGITRQGVAFVRGAPTAITQGVRDVANATKSLPDAIRSGARGTVGAYKIAAHSAAPSSSADPSPARLTLEWATGLGPERRTLGPDSSFTQEFVQAPSVQGYLRRHIADWADREGGVSGSYVVPQDRRANFGVSEFQRDLDAGDAASHFVGSWDARGERRGDAIAWTVENDSDLTSLGGGRILQKMGLPYLRSYERPWPGGRTHQTIRFRTDLDGRPLNTED